MGSRLTPLLLAQGYRVRVLDLMLYGDDGLLALQSSAAYSEWKSRFELIRGDIRNAEIVDQAVAGIDAVIHLAAISNDPTGEIDEVLTKQVNFEAIGLLLNRAKTAGVTRFINASSSSVFGIKDVDDVTEELEPEPITFYSKYKALSEWLVIAASSAGFTTVNIRPATVCGVSPRQRFDLTVNKLTADALSKGVITVHGGEQRRPNVGMTDMINLYADLLKIDGEKLNGKTFNFGFENHKVIEIAKLIQQELSDVGVRIEVTATFDNRDYHISSQKILKELSYQTVSSIGHEVALLRAAMDAGEYADIDAPKYYNMQAMELRRCQDSYSFLSRT